MPQKEQETTEFGSTQSPSFDDQKAGIPQSLFTWIKLAKGYEVEWDTFGRKGWYTQDPRLKPVDPTSVFPPDAAAVYIVFESAPLEDPTQFSAQWFLEGEGGTLPAKPFGQDILELPGYERYGFLELKRPGERWPMGICGQLHPPHGQQSFMRSIRKRCGFHHRQVLSHLRRRADRSIHTEFIANHTVCHDGERVGFDPEKLTPFYERFRDVCSSKEV
jgi:hypothetical protein